jgi:hypothetical protein
VCYQVLGFRWFGSRRQSRTNERLVHDSLVRRLKREVEFDSLTINSDFATWPRLAAFLCLGGVDYASGREISYGRSGCNTSPEGVCVQRRKSGSQESSHYPLVRSTAKWTQSVSTHHGDGLVRHHRNTPPPYQKRAYFSASSSFGCMSLTHCVCI